MAIYFIGKSQREIEDISIFAGSETIYGMNENENYAMFSLSDEDKHKPLSDKKKNESLESLRFGMEKFKLLDDDAFFVFSDKELFDEVMKKTTSEMKVTQKDTKIVENLKEFNKK